MTFEERAAVKLLIDSAVRVQRNVVYDTRIHGKERTYQDGCRCDECRAAATAARKERRERAVERALIVDRTTERWQRIRAAINDSDEADLQADRVVQAIQRRRIWG